MENLGSANDQVTLFPPPSKPTSAIDLFVFTHLHHKYDSTFSPEPVSTASFLDFIASAFPASAYS